MSFSCGYIAVLVLHSCACAILILVLHSFDFIIMSYSCDCVIVSWYHSWNFYVFISFKSFSGSILSFIILP